MQVLKLVAVRDAALSVEECLAAVADSGAGGTALFVGTVRDVDHGAAVASLEYSAHPDAPRVMTTLAEKVAADFPVRALAVVHRVGSLRVGDLAIVAAVSCPHREEAFDAARRLVDDVKAQAPIWKRQSFTDGTVEWVGCA